MSEKIDVRFIIQIAGKPVENVSKALDFVEKKIKEDKRFKLVEVDIIEPELEEKTTLYSGLIQVLVRFEDTRNLLEFIVEYAPSSVEVEHPSTLKIDAASLSMVLNDFTNFMLNANHQIRSLNAYVHHLKGGKTGTPTPSAQASAPTGQTQNQEKKIENSMMNKSKTAAKKQDKKKPTKKKSRK